MILSKADFLKLNEGTEIYIIEIEKGIQYKSIIEHFKGKEAVELKSYIKDKYVADYAAMDLYNVTWNASLTKI